MMVYCDKCKKALPVHRDVWEEERPDIYLICQACAKAEQKNLKRTNHEPRDN